MIQALLFDLDETLLDINFPRFVAVYEAYYAKILRDISRALPLATFYAFTKAYREMKSPNRDGILTNDDIFCRNILQATGVDLHDEILRAPLTFFEKSMLPKLNCYVQAKPIPFANKTLLKAKAMGLKLVLATNPFFSIECLHTRLGWAGIDPGLFEFITTSNTCYALKPSDRYYADILNLLNLRAHECIMIGNNPKMDIPSRNVPIPTLTTVFKKPNPAENRILHKDLFEHLEDIVARY